MDVTQILSDVLNNSGNEAVNVNVEVSDVL